MVPLADLGSQFEAQVLGARLGAEGIVWQLRGACSVYPFGSVELLVDAGDLDAARELLLLDEVEAVFAESDASSEVGEPPAPRRHQAVAWVAATAVLLAVVARLLSWLWM
jgi:hypothetical protein